MKYIKFYFLIILLSIAASVLSQCPNTKIAGKLTYANSQNTPLATSIIYLKNQAGAILDSSLTDQNGDYYFCGLNNGNYKLMARITANWGGSNAFDALLAIHHYVESITLNGINFSAGDINANNYINAIDALMILKRFVQMDTTFPIGDWVFEEPQITISDTTTQIINIHALCSGDIDGSYIPFHQTFISCGDTLTDLRDNQKYPTIQIGTQCWMKKNLNIGDIIQSTKTTESHSDCSNNGIIEKYCINNNIINCNVYGGLYDWNEMMKYDTTPGIQGICPSGWHLPTDEDWCQLTTYLDTNTNCNNNITPFYASTNAGGALQETGTLHWVAPNSGATNTSGFTALGSGDRDNIGNTPGLKWASPFWSSTHYSSTEAFVWSITRFMSPALIHISTQLTCGCPVRCIKN